jgi:hypothetical protein
LVVIRLPPEQLMTSRDGRPSTRRPSAAVDPQRDRVRHPATPQFTPIRVVYGALSAINLSRLFHRRPAVMDPDRLQRGEQVRVVTGPARLESTGNVWPCLSTAGCISVDGQRDESGRVGLVAVSGGGGEAWARMTRGWSSGARRSSGGAGAGPGRGRSGEPQSSGIGSRLRVRRVSGSTAAWSGE